MKPKLSFMSSLYVAEPEREDMPEIAESDEQTARVVYVFGLIPGLPPRPKPLGAGAAIPNRKFRHFSPFVDS